jgi:hypothetical protein
MDISVKDLQEAISIRQQIDNLQRRLSSLLRGAPQRPTVTTAPTAAGRFFSPATRAKLAAAAELVGQGGEALEEQLLLRAPEQQPLVREKVSLHRPDEGSFPS